MKISFNMKKNMMVSLFIIFLVLFIIKQTNLGLSDVNSLTDYQFKITYIESQTKPIQSIGFSPSTFNLSVFDPYETPGIDYGNDDVALLTFSIDTTETNDILSIITPYMKVESEPYISFMIYDGSSVQEALLSRHTAIDLLYGIKNKLKSSNTDGREILNNTMIIFEFDYDAVPESIDNCWYVTNPNQLDSNSNCPSPPYTQDPHCGDVCEIPIVNIISPNASNQSNENLWLNASSNPPTNNWWYSLNSGANTSFTPNTTKITVAKCKNNLTVYADSSGSVGSAYVQFNALTGDVDRDGDVDIFNMVKCSGAYTTNSTDPKFVKDCDFDYNGFVNIFDIVKMSGNYGKKC